MKFLALWKSIVRGDSLARAYLNERLTTVSISGVVVDVGGGRRSDYHALLTQTPGTVIHPLDGYFGGARIDFEKDLLPFKDGEVDGVLMFNILEHVYNYQYLVSEVHRILKSGGAVIGFVPFLVNYHPDPHDYFRYTKEALQKIFTDAGFSACVVEEIGGGPLSVNFNNMVLSLSRVFRVVLFPFLYGLDSVLCYLRPGLRVRYPLGYFFKLVK